jgi:hypothetical protein
MSLVLQTETRTLSPKYCDDGIPSQLREDLANQSPSR